jgi:hypothetical protein
MDKGQGYLGRFEADLERILSMGYLAAMKMAA